jgi:hypothetical protein
VFAAKGAVVTNIAHIPEALTAVMKQNGIPPDFRARGSLSLKPWIANDQGLVLPPDIALPAAAALPPYDMQIAALGKQVGAVIPRQNMKDKSGATVMDPRTQVTSVHGHSVLDLLCSHWKRISRCRWCMRSRPRTIAQCSTSRSPPR